MSTAVITQLVPEPENTGCSFQNAAAFGIASSFAYSTSDVITTTLNPHFSVRVLKIPKVSVGFIVSDATTTVISFCGTENFADVLIDVRYRLEKYGAGYIHRGFYNTWQAVRAQCFEFLQQNDRITRPVWVTGHSLGAALAFVCAWDLVESFSNVLIGGVYTFGAPRTFDETLANNFDNHARLKGRVFRFVNNYDLVPHYPKDLPIERYKHAGILEYIDSKGQIQTSITFWQNVRSTLGSVSDHRIGHYISRIQTLRDADATDHPIHPSFWDNVLVDPSPTKETELNVIHEQEKAAGLPKPQPDEVVQQHALGSAENGTSVPVDVIPVANDTLSPPSEPKPENLQRTWWHTVFAPYYWYYSSSK